MKKRILFVDDDTKYQELIARVLTREGYDLVLCDNAIDAIDIYHEESFDLILSDVMMESVDGMQLLSYIRNYDEDIKIILLTATEADDLEVKALSLLANDYIRKPVTIDILIARIARVLMDTQKKKITMLSSEAENIKIDITTRKVYKDDEQVHLTVREYSLLLFFMRNKNKVFSREDLLEQVWRINEDTIDLRSVDALIKKIRAKLFLTSIYSVRGVGYEWNED
ncbi:MAG: response regulator transcription factor [Coprobacillaceae bacterium]